MKRLFFMVSGLLLLSSCYSSHDEELMPAPQNLIDKDKIILILADVEIAESALRQKQNFGHEIADTQEEYYHAIFTSYGVTLEQFESSLAYYRQDIETMTWIYEEVITRLSVIESEIQHE